MKISQPGTTALLQRAALARVSQRQGRVQLVPSLASGARLCWRTRPGSVRVHLRVDPGIPGGAVFMPFAYRQAAASLLTKAQPDPIGQIPEFKYYALALTPLAEAAQAL